MSNRPFVGARAEEFVTRRLNHELGQRRGWKPYVVPFMGYGAGDHVRVLARVLMRQGEARTQLGAAADSFLGRRGWRNFTSLPVPRSTATVSLAGASVEVQTDRAGYVDVHLRLEGLEPGLHEAVVTPTGGEATKVPVRVFDADATFGLVSDLDDTVISTMLPRLFIAAWNSLVVTEEGRREVPGMAQMYSELLADHPDAPVVYVSTGAWNTYPFLRRFLQRHGFPDAPMLLTDWGPTNTGWFRSGPDHKRTSLRELARDFPQVKWVLVGDDGQHDPELYAEFADLQPDHVRAIALRQLSMAEQVLAHGSTTVLRDADEIEWHPQTAPEVRAPDGFSLWPKLKAALAGE